MDLRANLTTLFHAVDELYRSSPLQTMLLGASVLVSGFLPLLGIYALAQVVETITVSGAGHNLSQALSLWVLSFALPGLLSAILVLQQSALSESMFRYLSTRLMTATNHIDDLNTFETESIHQNLGILSDNITNRPVNLIVTLAGICTDGVAVISITISLITITLIAPLLAVALGTIFFFIAAKSQSELWSGSLKRSRQSRMMSYLFSLTLDRSAMPELRVYDAGGFLVRKFEDEHISARSIMNRVRVRVARLSLMSAVAVCIIGTLMIFDILRITSGQNLVPAHLVFLLQGILTIQLTTKSLSEQLGWLKGHLLFFEKYFEHLERITIMPQQVGPIPDTHPRPAAVVVQTDEPITQLRLEDCIFGYGTATPILQGINLTLTRGEIVAVVGENGAGKTTLTRVLLGLLQPQSGNLLVNDLPIEEFGRDRFWAACSLVPQDFAKFRFTIKESITLGCKAWLPDTGPIAAFANERWLDRSQQLGREFGGIDLSGGQWQRIAILRAFVRHQSTDVIILDEPTSAIDPLVENQVYDMMELLAKDRISVFVTHRMSTISYATRVLLIDAGTIIADGTHQELYASNALYRAMYDSQAKRFMPYNTDAI